MNRQLFHNLVAQYGTKTVMDTNQVLEWSGGAHCYLPSLKFYGNCEQYGTPTQTTPTPDNPLPVSAFDGTVTVSSRDNYLYTPKLYGIGEHKDEWDYVTGKGVRRVKEIVLDGVSDYCSVVNVGTSNGAYYARVDLEHIYVDNGGAKHILSSHFKPLRAVAYGNIYVNSNDRILLCHDSLSSVNMWNAWLAEQYANGTPVTVYYALAEPQPFEERPDYDPYQPIPNESGKADIIDSGMNTPFEVSYVTHSTPQLIKDVDTIYVLMSLDNYVLKDKNGIYLSAKE